MINVFPWLYCKTNIELFIISIQCCFQFTDIDAPEIVIDIEVGMVYRTDGRHMDVVELLGFLIRGLWVFHTHWIAPDSIAIHALLMRAGGLFGTLTVRSASPNPPPTRYMNLKHIARMHLRLPDVCQFFHSDLTPHQAVNT